MSDDHIYFNPTYKSLAKANYECGKARRSNNDAMTEMDAVRAG